ncbi:MAG TPA: hypothetical protein VF599_01400, partial [Pyrinomonadaceae bacterium]
MKKISLLVLLSLVFSVSCLFYFQPSKAQNKFSEASSAPERTTVNLSPNGKLKDIPQLIKSSKTAG